MTWKAIATSFVAYREPTLQVSVTAAVDPAASVNVTVILWVIFLALVDALTVIATVVGPFPPVDGVTVTVCCGGGVKDVVQMAPPSPTFDTETVPVVPDLLRLPRLSVVGATHRRTGAAVTVSVTITVCGELVAFASAIVTVAVWTPTARFVRLTDNVSGVAAPPAAIVPLVGDTVSHGALSVIA